MQKQPKYQKFSKLFFPFNDIPTKILKLHRTKWKKIQTITLKKQNLRFNPYIKNRINKRLSQSIRIKKLKKLKGGGTWVKNIPSLKGCFRVI